MKFLIISGMSGAGKSRVAGVLEDLNYYCVDNMPVALIPQFAELCIEARGRYDRVALVTDIRERDNSEQALRNALDRMSRLDLDYRILFLDAATDVIVRRYKETRRRHPLAPDGADVAAAVERERARLADLKERADYKLDTSDLTLGQLAQRVGELFGGTASARFTLNFSSFGFKHSTPMDDDLVFDVRFLPNPYYVAELAHLTGEDAAVRDYVLNNTLTQEFLTKLYDLLDFLIPHYITEGKHALGIAIGCTGGRHRSVAIARVLSDRFRANGADTTCIHRDIER